MLTSVGSPSTPTPATYVADHKWWRGVSKTKQVDMVGVLVVSVYICGYYLVFKLRIHRLTGFGCLRYQDYLMVSKIMLNV